MRIAQLVRPRRPVASAAGVLAGAATVLVAASAAVALPAPAGAPAVAPARASSRAQVRLGSAPAVPRGGRLLAGVASTTPMRVTVVLKPRNPGALAAYAEAVATPGSPRFHRYITPAQFAERFGPSHATTEAVLASLRAHGLVPGQRSANGLAVTARADAGAFERAFALSFARFGMPGGDTVVLNTLAPLVDARIAGALQTVVGFSSLEAMHPLRTPRASTTARGSAITDPGTGTGTGTSTSAPVAHAAAAGPQPCAAARAAAPAQDAYTTDQIASAYDFSGLYAQGDEGQGETIAVYELEPYAASDIAAYESCYGTVTSITPIAVDGGAGAGGPGSGEAALDIEQVIAFAPRARVLVYEGPNSFSNDPGSGPYDVFSEIVSQDRAQVVTNSWGNCEPDEGSSDASAENILFEEAAAQGQTVLSAAGDDGSEDCYGYDEYSGTSAAELTVDDPASQALVTGVGGTTLKTLGPPLVETVWNSGSSSADHGIQPGSGGGGISSFWAMPAYQSAAPAALDVHEQGISSASPCHVRAGYCRELPDVSADADPNTGYLIYYNGSGQVAGAPAGWQGTGGTSGAAPLWAALFALADGEPACHGSPIGFANPALYDAAATGEGVIFHDITAGENDFTGRMGGRYAAGIGYDMASGLGSPDAAALAAVLCAKSLTLADPGTQRAIVGTPASLQLSAGDGAGVAIHFSATHLPPGLRLSASTGRIAGVPSSAGQWAVAAQVSDAAGSVRDVAFLYTVAGRPAISSATLTSVAAARPQLTLSLNAGRYEAAITAIAITPPPGLWFAGRAGVWRTAGGGNTGSTRYSYAVAGGVLELRLLAASTRLAVRFAHDLLRARSALALSVSRHATAELTFTVTVTDADHDTTTLSLTIRPGS